MLLIITVYSCRLLLATRALSSFEAVNGCTVWTVVSYVNLQGGYCCSAKPCHCYSCYCWIGDTLVLLGAAVYVYACACLFLPYACVHTSVSSVICVLSIVRLCKCVYFGIRLDTVPTTTGPQFGAKTHSAPNSSVIQSVSRQVIPVCLSASASVHSQWHSGDNSKLWLLT